MRSIPVHDLEREKLYEMEEREAKKAWLLFDFSQKKWKMLDSKEGKNRAQTQMKWNDQNQSRC